MADCCEKSADDIFNAFDKIFGESGLVSQTHYELKTDGDASEIYVAVPGYLKVELNVQVDKSKNQLVITGKPSPTSKGTPRGKFAKPFTLSFVYKPTVHDVNHIDSSLEDGVLKVSVPLFPKAKQEDYIVSFPIR